MIQYQQSILTLCRLSAHLLLSKALKYKKIGSSFQICFGEVQSVMKAQSAQIIKSVNQKLPTGNTPQDIERLNAYWPQFDKNKNGYLSQAQIDQGVRYVMKLPDLFPLAPVVNRAFKASKAKLKAITKYGDGFVSQKEFPYVIKYIKQFYILWAIFNEMDQNNDRKVSLAEFNLAMPIFKANKIPVPDVKALFNEIDKNKGGQIQFDEFTHWVLLNRYRLEI